MKKFSFLQKAAFVAAMVFTVFACKKQEEHVPQASPDKVSLKEMMSENGANPDDLPLKTEMEKVTAERAQKSKSGHYLYTETNASARNEIIVYEVNTNGELSLMETVPSGGTGTGTGLGSQGAVVLDEAHEMLYAVNAGDHSISSFKVKNNGGLKLTHTTPSMGKTPVSLAVHDNLLYVLNRGSDAIQGFKIGGNGKLTDIVQSNRPLSGMKVDAPQISFTPNGFFVVVTEKATNIVGTFKVNNNGSIMSGKFTKSDGKTPFGFEWSRNKFMIVSNAAGGAAVAGSSTAYTINANGIPKTTNGAIANYQAAPCWVAITKNGRFAYVTNTASNNVSSYYIADDGGLYLAKGVAATSGMGPLDVVVSNNIYVFVLTSRSNSIDEYYRKPFGELGAIGHVSGVPASATGLASF